MKRFLSVLQDRVISYFGIAALAYVFAIVYVLYLLYNLLDHSGELFDPVKHRNYK